MSKKNFYSLLAKEVKRVDKAKVAKRHEKVVERFVFGKNSAPQAVIHGRRYRVFNSNDYLGLRFDQRLHKGELKASKNFGSGPGAVRFISGSLSVFQELEKALARFHKRDDAMVFSSAFAANLGTIFPLLRGQSKDSLVNDSVLVISDELNHRSIIDGIRLAGLPKEQRAIFAHIDNSDLERVLKENKGRFKRVLVLTDGIFSMLGEYPDLKGMVEVARKYDQFYEHGVITLVDDSHGVAAFGQGGRGIEEVCRSQADVLVGTMGKGFGADGGYVVGDKEVIDYLRESAATYIYSNPFSPGTAGAALEAVRLVASLKGKSLLARLNSNIRLFKELIGKAGFSFAADSSHAIQSILVGDAVKTKALTDKLFRAGILVTNINYPVVAPGKDEIRVQISAAHTQEDIEYFVKTCTKVGKELGLV